MERRQTLFDFDAATFASALAMIPLGDSAKRFAERMREHSQPGAMLPEGLTCGRHDGQILFYATQTRLGELFGVDDRTIRRWLHELRSIGVLVDNDNESDGGYAISERRIHRLALPNGDRCDDRLNNWLLRKNGDLFGDGIGADRHPEFREAEPDIGADMAPDMTPDIGADMTPDIARATMGHGKHINKNHGNMDHGVLNFRKLGWGRGRIENNHVRQIVQTLHREAFDFLDSEGLAAFGGSGAWMDTDARRLDRAAMWHYAATNDSIRNPAAVLRTLLKTGAFDRIRPEDEAFAKRLLRERRERTQIPVFTPKSVEDLPEFV